MWKNYFITAFRNLWRNRVFTTINTAGLALGIAVFLLIAQYVAFEWGVNRFHKNYHSLYRASTINRQGTQETLLPPGFAPLVQQKFTGIENYVRLAGSLGGGVITTAGNKSFREEQVAYVDGNFFNVFSFELLSGSPLLTEPKTMAISESQARKYFGSADVTGKILTVNNQFGKTDYKVVNVFKDIPEQSDIRGDIFLSLNTLETAANRNENDWADPNGLESGFCNIFLQFKKDADVQAITANISRYLHTLQPQYKDQSFYCQPFSQLHLAPTFNYPYQTFGSLALVVAFSAVALLILLIAWVNYINLSTAQALNRARETGVRKVLGASRGQLMLQYLTETFLLTASACLAAVLLVQLLQPLYNSFTGKQLSLSTLNQGWFWVAGIALLITGSLLSGGYVAFVLSGFQPVKTIRGKIENTARGFSLRKGLVVFQFSVSILFIIATIVLYRQLNYMQSQNLGMNIKQLLVLKGPTNSSEEQADRNIAFKNQLTMLPFVSKFSASNGVPGGGYNFQASGITKLNPATGDDRKNYQVLITDNRFFDTYNIQFKDGQSYDNEEANHGWMNSKKLVLNEKAAAQLGFKPNEPVAGKKLRWADDTYEVAGVIKDYHHLSLRKAIEPVIYLPSVSFVYFTIQTDGANMPSKLATLENLCRQYFPGNPFEYFFADESYDKQYNEEKKLGNVFIASALTAIFIACMGLFGLASFSARQRVKEIGIRKVLGASVANIVHLISKDFIKLVAIAIVIASPVAWFIMHKWLQDFAYRINISWWMFALAGGIAVFIALFTVSFQAIKAALLNPVKSLRSE
ncbi:ABC transporter permease [Foetidibacter luteolus]|uniref:ABC transporter permease n=1 Tax=Foetidibacter luteolus TaxID=2608880 RepID=UPI00129A5D40|nr:ABC transporter permease [Foetidibacter luteolus]